MRAGELNSLQQFNVFIIRVYLNKWYTCQSPASSLLSGLQILKEFVQYNDINSKIAEVTCKKFSGYLWYLSEMLYGLTLFDSRLSVEENRKMVSALQKSGTDNPPRHIDMKKILFFKLSCLTLTQKNSKKLLVLNKISLQFLLKDPSLWEQDSSFIEAREKVQRLEIVNDLGERVVALIQAFNPLLTKQEDQKQYLLHIVEEHQKQFPSARKSVIVKVLILW